MRAYYQWLQGVRRRAAVRSRCWRWVENALSAVSAKRFGGIAAALAMAAILGAAVGFAAKHAGACSAGDGIPSGPARLSSAYASRLNVASSRAEGEPVARSEAGGS